MPTASFYLGKEYHDKWMAIENKRQWIEEHLDTDVQREIVFSEPSKEPNVPRLPEVSTYRWNQHLKDNGFDVGELPNE